VLRLVPSARTDATPSTVGKYLLPHERHVISVREHPIVLAGRALAVLAGLAVAIWLSSSLADGNTTTLLIIWILWGVLLAWLAAKIIDWWVHYFVVTSRRLMLTTGVLLRRVNAIPLDKVTDIEFRQTQTGKLFRYGTFEVFAQNQDPRMRIFRFLPDPQQVYLEASGLIFKE
jgi:uncharacterized membrane protein YdbT with pleckstrin-like domain